MEAPQELVAALAAHGEALAAELRALDDMPQVKLTPASVFDRAKPPGSIAQQRGVICKLRCCGRQLDQKCNDLTGDAACPTHVEAARLLRAKVAKQTARDLGTGLAGRRKVRAPCLASRLLRAPCCVRAAARPAPPVAPLTAPCAAPAASQEAQDEGKKLAQMLKAPTEEKQNLGFLAIQARERWSTSEEVHYRPGHFWLAQAPSVLEVRKVETRCTIEGVMFTRDDYLVRIGRYFDRVATDPSGLTFEEWTPPDGGSFIINATELRAVNFTMTPTVQPPPLKEVRRSGRRAAVVSTPPQPPPTEYSMDRLVDDDIRRRCW